MVLRAAAAGGQTDGDADPHCLSQAPTGLQAEREAPQTACANYRRHSIVPSQ